KTKTETVQKAGRSLTTITNPDGESGSWWIEGDDVVLAPPPSRSADAVIEALDGKQPSAEDHPFRAELVRNEDGFEPVMVSFREMAARPEMRPRARQVGLDGVKRLDFRWGFQDEAVMSVLRVVAPAPRRGVLALLDQPTFELSSLPPMPPDLHGFTA